MSRHSFPRAAAFAVSFLLFFLTTLPAQPATMVPIKGNVRLANGTPVCAMVLANGQYMFSCDGTGAFSLNVPLDANAQITLFVFADGFSPYRVTAGPRGLPSVVRTVTAAPGSPFISTTRELACAANNWVRITGEVESFGGAPLCAMALANGQHMFSCGANQGRYDLTVPADENGHITLFAFADGFQPYSETLIAPDCSDAVGDCPDVSGSWFAQEDLTLTCTYLGDTFTDTESDSGTVYINQHGCSVSYLPVHAEDYPGGEELTRYGVVNGNQMSVQGPFLYVLDPTADIRFSQNLAAAICTVNANQMSCKGSGVGNGTADGVPFNCSGTSTGTFSR